MLTVRNIVLNKFSWILFFTDLVIFRLLLPDHRFSRCIIIFYTISVLSLYLLVIIRVDLDDEHMTVFYRLWNKTVYSLTSVTDFVYPPNLFLIVPLISCRIANRQVHIKV